MSKVETDINKRWEEGTAHHPKSEEIARAIGEIDFLFGGDHFGFKFGGDGDNGEHLTYLLDIYFESIDSGEKPWDVDYKEFFKNKGVKI